METNETRGAPALRHELHHGRVVRCHVDRPANVGAMLAGALARAPDAAAFADGEDRGSYAELADRVARAAGRIAALGIAPGDRVALMLDNRIDALVAMFAVARLGAIVVPMSIRQRAPETAFALIDSGATVLVHEAALADRLPAPDATPALRHRIAIDGERHLWDGGTLHPEAASVDEDAPFCILYTSGTTGRPKGAVITQLAAVANCIGIAAHYGLRDGETTILAVPASHVTGAVMVLLQMVHVAGKTVFQRDFKARTFLVLAAAERLSYAIMVPAMYALCLMEPDYDAFDLSAWRIGAYGGAPMAPALIEALAMRMPALTLFHTYGATETAAPAVSMPAADGRTRIAEIGRALPYVDLLVMDEQGRQVPPGTQGEVWIAGSVVTPHYWNDPVATAAGFAGGYWKSGDLGAIDADGYLRLFDRKKDMISRGGFKVYSTEVEATLLAHPAVLEAAVVGYPCPVLGERVAAYLVLKGDVAGGPEGGADAATLRAHCAERLSDYKVPERITILDTPLPRNANGKLMKAPLRALPES